MRIFKTLIAGVLIAALSTTFAQTSRERLVFVQTAASATLAPNTAKPGWHVLTLNNISKQTQYFTQRPQRVAGFIDTPDFVDQWGKGDDNFAENHPNGSLTFKGGESGSPVMSEAVLLLTKPNYDSKKQTLTYEVKALDKMKLPKGTMNGVSLFIDNWHPNCGPLGKFCGG